MIHIMDAFNAFKIYMGLKAHFNSNYDFTKYGGKTRASKSSYLKRKDKHFFGKVARTSSTPGGRAPLDCRFPLNSDDCSRFGNSLWNSK